MPSMEASAAPNGPVAKRQKLTARPKREVEERHAESRLFAPFRTVGLISPTDVPFTALPLGKTTFQITTSVGRSLQTYDLRRGLNLVFITRPQTPAQITATTAWKDRVLAAWGGGSEGDLGVWVYKRGKKVDELQIPVGATERISQVLVFGSWIIGRCSTRIEIWRSDTLEHYTTLSSPYTGLAKKGDVYTGGVCSMPTYLNKIFAGRQDGSVEIWNVSTGKLLYTILPPTSDAGPVTALQPAPVLSLLAIAYKSGPVVMHDVRTDKEVLRINRGNLTGYAVDSISFRTDGLGAGEDGRKDGVMATASRRSGDVTLWDLNDGGRKMGVLYGAHNPPSAKKGGVSGGVSKVEFLAGQAVMLTSGLDNSLKSWIFDETPFSPVPRILHARAGHAAPVSSLQFLPSDADGSDAVGKWLLSASQDRSLWGWSLRRDGQSTELSQGHVTKKAKKKGLLNGSLSSSGGRSLEDLKAPKITCMACSLNRDGGMGALPGAQSIWGNHKSTKVKQTAAESSTTGWESVITGHEGDKLARTWFWGRKRAGRWAFETGDGGVVTSVAMSPCGTFALVGSSLGGIDLFNLQSGVHRQRFPARLSQKQANQLKLQHDEGRLDDPARDGSKEKTFARGQGKHTAAVTGLAVDNLNKIVISSGADSKLKFWAFGSGLLMKELDWSMQASITQLQYHRPSDLLVLVCSDDAIRILDVTTRKLVRELFVSPALNLTKSGNTGQILDTLITPSARWLVASTRSSFLLTWDLPTAHLIDAVRLPSPATSIAFAPTEEYLATAHPDTVGVALWTNRTLFSHVPIRRIKDVELATLAAIATPTASGEGGTTVLSAVAAPDPAPADSRAADPDEDDDLAVALALPSVDDLTDNLTTLSLVPAARTHTLRHIDAVRARNQPTAPPTKPEKAPFFLPALPDPAAPAASASVPGSSSSSAAPRTALPPSRFLVANGTTTPNSPATLDGAALVAHLAALPPSQVDYFIRSLDAHAPYAELTAFVRAMAGRLRARRDYEAVQVWMGRFLEVWGEVVLLARRDEEEGGEESEWEGMSVDGEEDEGKERGGGELVGALREWRVLQEAEAARLEELVGYCKGVLGYLRGV